MKRRCSMIKVAAVRPPDRAAAVKGWRTELAYEKQPKLQAWGLEVNRNLVKVDARLLPPPVVNYGARETVKPSQGNWNLRGKLVSR